MPPINSEKILSKGLRLTARNGHEHIVNDLLENGASPNLVDNNVNSALHCSLFDHYMFNVEILIRIIKALVLHGADLSLRNMKDELVFHFAIKARRGALLKAVIEAAATQSTRIILDSSNPSVLQYAVEWGLDDSVSCLLDIYSDIVENNHPSEAGKTLLGTAARRETPIALRQLLSRGLNIKALDVNGSSTLYNAATMENHGETFNVLMEASATDDSSREDGRRAIHAAAEIASSVAISMLRTLLVAGEDPNATTKEGRTP